MTNEWDYEDDPNDLLDDDPWGDAREDIEALCECCRPSIGEACEECGTPLCPMCFECGAGFCRRHPSPDYRPSYAY